MVFTLPPDDKSPGSINEILPCVGIGLHHLTSPGLFSEPARIDGLLRH